MSSRRHSRPTACKTRIRDGEGRAAACCDVALRAHRVAEQAVADCRMPTTSTPASTAMVATLNLKGWGRSRSDAALPVALRCRPGPVAARRDVSVRT